MTADSSDKAAVSDLEHLTGLAFAFLRKVGMPEIKQRHEFYVLAMFKAICLNADSVLRLHPASVFYSDAGEKIWNPAAVATLARMLMEAYANLHYFGGNGIADEQREFRCIVADLQRVRKRMSVGERVSSESPSTESEADVLLQHIERYQANLPNELAFWLRGLETNVCFQHLNECEQAAWRTGRFRKGMPPHWREGYLLNRKERAESAGVGPGIRGQVYGLLSAYAHAGPQAADRIFWFQPFDWVARAMQFRVFVMLCSSLVARAVIEFAGVFPDCKTLVSSELGALVSCYGGLLNPSRK